MKFGWLIGYNMRNLFLEIHTQNVVKKLFPDPFLKIQNQSFSHFIYILCQVVGYRNVLKLCYRPLAFTV